MAPKCYSIQKVKDEKPSFKNRCKGIPNYKIFYPNYVNGLDTHRAEKIFRPLKNQLDSDIQPISQTRMKLDYKEVTINNHSIEFLKNFTQKNYVFDNNIITEIRDHYMLEPIREANLKVLPDMEKFCSDEHLQKLIHIEKKIIGSSKRYTEMNEFANEVLIPILFDMKKQMV